MPKPKYEKVLWPKRKVYQEPRKPLGYYLNRFIRQLKSWSWILMFIIPLAFLGWFINIIRMDEVEEERKMKEMRPGTCIQVLGYSEEYDYRPGDYALVKEYSSYKERVTLWEPELDYISYEQVKKVDVKFCNNLE